VSHFTPRFFYGGDQGRGAARPAMVGGAALTRRYVEEDCVRAYEAGVLPMPVTPSTVSA
jgi:cobalamin-dependent methionine synthase I